MNDQDKKFLMINELSKSVPEPLDQADEAEMLRVIEILRVMVEQQHRIIAALIVQNGGQVHINRDIWQSNVGEYSIGSADKTEHNAQMKLWV